MNTNTNVTPIKCYCDAPATHVNEQTSATPEHFVCVEHINDGYRPINDSDVERERALDAQYHVVLTGHETRMLLALVQNARTPELEHVADVLYSLADMCDAPQTFAVELDELRAQHAHIERVSLADVFSHFGDFDDALAVNDSHVLTHNMIENAADARDTRALRLMSDESERVHATGVAEHARGYADMIDDHESETMSATLDELVDHVAPESDEPTVPRKSVQ